jgi:membrane-bound lytic murein transglycosylase B
MTPLFSTPRAQRGKIRLAPILLWVLSVGLIAPDAAAGFYSDRPAAIEVIKSAELAGVDAAWAADLLSAAERQQSILDAIARPAEKTKPWHQYRQIFLTQRRIDEGVAFWDQHATVLDSVSLTTGVPPEVIVAIIGVETFYGRITGSYRVIDALATLAFDYPKRSTFFTGELEAFLLLAWEADKDPLRSKVPMPAPWGTVSSCPRVIVPTRQAMTGRVRPIFGIIPTMRSAASATICGRTAGAPVRQLLCRRQ